MPYLNLDDNFADHPKVDRLSDAAFRLHVAGLCYAAKHLTNGSLPSDRPARLVSGYKVRSLDELLKSGLWIQADDGYRIHDYLDWNKDRTWWEKKRAADAERKRKWRESRQQDEEE